MRTPEVLLVRTLKLLNLIALSTLIALLIGYIND
jgi:hypothetical protein